MLALKQATDEPEAPPPIPTAGEKVRAAWQALTSVAPPVFDLAFVFIGVALGSVGAGLIYLPAGLIVAGVGLFYLGAWHDLVVAVALKRRGD